MPCFIKIENNYSWLLTDDKKVKEVLWKALRFPSKNYFFNPSYNMRLWDGYVEFFKKESGRFLTGLLPEIKVALKHLGESYEIKDLREPFHFLYDKVDENLLNDPCLPYRITLRDYQIDYINQTIRNKRGIISSPPGSGKTNTFIGILKTLPPKTPTLVLVNQKQLVEQNYEEIKKWNIPHVGRFHGDTKQPDYITCATVQSAHLLQEWLPRIKVLIVDEIHENMAKTNKKVYAALKNASVRIAMSGTPFKFGGKDYQQKYEVKGWIGPLFTTSSTESGLITTEELQERNILSSAECIFFIVDEPNLPYDIYTDAVTRGIAENVHFHDMITKLSRKLTGRSLIVVERIEQGDRLAEKIPEAVWIQGKDNLQTRKYVVEKLRSDKNNVIAIATRHIFNTGIDVFIHNLINAAGGKAHHQIIQRMGRGLRMANDKDHLFYFDFFFTINDYLNDHSKKRIKLLEKDGHEVKKMKLEDWLNAKE